LNQTIIIMEDFKLLVELHKNQKRQGPGSKESTLKAFDLTGFSRNEKIKVLDIGCGTGAQTLDLAQNTRAAITAVDYFSDFLNILKNSADQLGLIYRVTPLKSSMDQLNLPKRSFDLIWSEGAVYIMGFSKAVTYFKDFLQPNGVIAFSEISWLTKERPEEIEKHWNANYSEMATIDEKIDILERNKFKILGHFTLPQKDWIENYYQPLENFLPEFSKNFGEEVDQLIADEKEEFAIYQKFKEFYSYEFYIAQIKS